MSTYKEVDFGQRVSFTAILEKRKRLNRWTNPDNGVEETAETKSTEWVRVDLERPLEGIYIGWRDVLDMDYDWDYDEYSDKTYGYYEFGQRHRVALVAFDSRRNPARIPFDALAALATSPDTGLSPVGETEPRCPSCLSENPNLVWYHPLRGGSWYSDSAHEICKPHGHKRCDDPFHLSEEVGE